MMVTGLVQSLLPVLLLSASLTIQTSSSSAIARSKLAPLPLATVSASLRPSSFYVVKSGDSLGSIAKTQYGDGKFWTTLWNDNPWIEDPNVVYNDWQLKINPITPIDVAMLKPELLEKLTAEGTQSLDSQAGSALVVSTPASQVTNSLSPSPATLPSSPSVLTEEQINFLGNCESGLTATRNSGNGYYGAFQFSPGTWNSMGTGYERADLAPLDVQKDAVQRLVSRSSVFGQFPGCSAKMHALGML